MIRIRREEATIIAIKGSVLILIRMAIVFLERSKDIYRRQKDIDQMAYMHEGLIMGLSVAFYIVQNKIEGPSKIGLGPFLFKKCASDWIALH
jgi:hypothetical protein